MPVAGGGPFCRRGCSRTAGRLGPGGRKGRPSPRGRAGGRRPAAPKQQCLRAAYRRFRQAAPPARRAQFEAFRQARNPSLARFASFEVLRRRLEGPWWEWPAKWQKPSAAALQQLRSEADEEIGYVEYVQWIADQQLMRCRDRGRELGLPIGLYLDVAVGGQAGGFDAWSGTRDTI